MRQATSPTAGPSSGTNPEEGCPLTPGGFLPDTNRVSYLKNIYITWKIFVLIFMEFIKKYRNLSTCICADFFDK